MSNAVGPGGNEPTLGSLFVKTVKPIHSESELRDPSESRAYTVVVPAELYVVSALDSGI